MSSVVSVGRAVQKAKPLVSTTRAEAKARVISLYRAWYRQSSLAVFDYKLPISKKKAEAKVRELFEANRHVRDLRVIDALVLKGQMELQETSNFFKEEHHLMMYFKDTVEPPPSDFMSKFLAGQSECR